MNEFYHVRINRDGIRFLEYLSKAEMLKKFKDGADIEYCEKESIASNKSVQAMKKKEEISAKIEELIKVLDLEL